MQLKNDEYSFGVVARVLHWVVAVLVIGLFLLGLWMRDLDYTSRWYNLAPDLHVSFGLVLAALIVFRFWWRWTNPLPVPLGDNRFEHAIAALVHAFLYALLVAMVVTGFMYATADGEPAEFFWIAGVPGFSLDKAVADWVSEMHEWFSWAIIALVGLHTVGAFKHHLVDKDDTLRRMVRGSRVE